MDMKNGYNCLKSWICKMDTIVWNHGYDDVFISCYVC